MENKDQKAIKEKILEKIKSGGVKMKPKIYFVLKSFLITGGILLFFVFLLFLVSLIHFHLRASGLWYLPRFGSHGLGIYFKSLPWFLILFCLILVFVLEIFSRKFSFVWKRPLIYSLLAIIFILLIGTFILEKTSVHPRLLFKTKIGQMPSPFAPIYREFGMPKFEDVHRGIVEKLTESGFLLRKADDELLTVILTPDTRFPFGKEIEINDSVVVIGKKEDDTVHAFGFRKIDDQFKSFEHLLPHPPIPRLPMK